MPKHPILLLLLLAAQDPRPASVTFTKDVAPIVFARCAACHREGEAAPFPLVTFVDVKKRAKQILSAVESRQMPPWKPVEGYGDFVGERRMKPDEIATLQRWVDQGCSEGDSKDLPPLPKFPDGWMYGEPDLVVTMPEAYPVPAEGRDIYRAFVLPLNLTEDKYVRAFQYRPSNKRVVHHALLFFDLVGESRKKDAADPDVGFDGWNLGLGSISGGSLGTWTPGGVPQPFPDEMAKHVRKNADLVMQVHLNPTGKPEKEQSQVGLWFTKEKPKRQIMMIPFDSWQLDLPPGEREIKVESSVVLPIDVDLFGVIPHAHFLGRECKVWAADPEGKEIPIIWIRDWNFNLQEQYRYRQHLRLRKGSEVRMVWTYDNSSSNPRNPFSPPRRIHWGERTTDEMSLAFLEFATSTLPDQLLIYMAFLAKRKGK